MVNSTHNDAVLRATAKRASRVDGTRSQPAPADVAARTSAALDALASWHWPHWLDRQLRPAHVAFVPQGAVAAVENLTGRSWTTVGTIGAGSLALVDAAGFAVPSGATWGVDWVVRGETRWHVPAHEPGVRQSAVAGAPVVETALRVGSGDVVQRVFGVAGERDAGDLVVVEFHNNTPVPIAVAVAIRPIDLLGVGVIDALEFDGVHCRINEQPAVVFTKEPSLRAQGDAGSPDSLGVVMREEADAGATRRVTCALGLANGAAVFPIPHYTTLRVLIAPNAPRRSQPRPPDREISPAAVAKGWNAHLDRAATIELPSESLQSGYRAALRRLLLAVDDTGFGTPPGIRVWGSEHEALIANALSKCGLGGSVASALVARLDDQRLNSWLRSEDATLDRNLRVIDAACTHWRCARDSVMGGAVIAPLGRLLQWCARRLERGEGEEHAQRLASAAATLAGLAAAVGQPRLAADLEEASGVLRWRAGRVTSTPPEPVVAAEVFNRAGFDVAATLQSAESLIGAEDAAGLELLLGVLARASSTGALASTLHPRTGAGSAGCGDDPVVAGLVALAVRSVAVVERGESALALLPVMPAEWRGNAIDVRNVPALGGQVSYSVRWHGARPALLWEVVNDAPVTLSAPGLDPQWSTEARSGEALLSGGC